MSAIRGKGKQIAPYIDMVMQLTEKGDCSPKDVAAALLYLSEEQSASTDSFTSSESSSSEGFREKRHEYRRDRDKDHRDRDHHRRRGDKFEHGKRKPDGKSAGFGGDRFDENKPRKKFGSSSGRSNQKSAPNDAYSRSEKTGDYARKDRTEKFAGEARKQFHGEKQREKSSHRPFPSKEDKPKRERAWKK